MKQARYGIELVLDLHDCDTEKFSRSCVGLFLREICSVIRMEPNGEPHFWEDKSGTPHLHGVSAFQFISTSNIVVHALDILNAVYINIFSCRDFDVEAAAKFSAAFFGAQAVRADVVERI
jgi:S-adenosylmethionine decarboxylase